MHFQEDDVAELAGQLGVYISFPLEKTLLRDLSYSAQCSYACFQEAVVDSFGFMYQKNKKLVSEMGLI